MTTRPKAYGFRVPPARLAEAWSPGQPEGKGLSPSFLLAGDFRRWLSPYIPPLLSSSPPITHPIKQPGFARASVTHGEKAHGPVLFTRARTPARGWAGSMEGLPGSATSLSLSCSLQAPFKFSSCRIPNQSSDPKFHIPAACSA